jgi:hypothetical protein
MFGSGSGIRDKHLGPATLDPDLYPLSAQKFVSDRRETSSDTFTILLFRVELQVSAHKALACCLMFPADYPRSVILIELKSRFLSPKLLNGLARVAEQEANKYLGKPQVLLWYRYQYPMLSFLKSL